MIFLCQKFAKIVVMLKIHLWAAIFAPCEAIVAQQDVIMGWLTLFIQE